MPRLLLVARNPGLAFGLASASDDIIEVRPSLIGRLAVTADMADVVVIEQEMPGDALATLDTIRAGGLLAPALLVASARPEWSDFDPGSRPSVAVLDPPITQDRLNQSVGSTSRLPVAVLALPAAEDEREVDATVPDPAGELETPGSPVETPVPDHVEVIFSDALTPDDPMLLATVEAVQAVAQVEEEDLPIAAAAADARAEESLEVFPEIADEPEDVPAGDAVDVLDLPDGPADLEPPDDPYATATHVPLPDDGAEPDPQGFEVAEAEPSSDDAPEPTETARETTAVEEITEAAEDTEATAEPAPDEVRPEDERDETEAEPARDPDEGEDEDALAAVVAAAVAEAAAADHAEDDPEPESPDSPDSAAETEAEAEDAADPTDATEQEDAAAEATDTGEPSDGATPEVTAEDEPGDADNRGPDAPVLGERVLDPAMLAIPSAAPMRQPEEIRLGTIGRDVLPAVVLYDEEDELIVADGTPSPAAWLPEPTEPVVAWQGPNAAKDARVYAEMASLMAASGELLADEPESDEPAYDSSDDSDIPSIDLSQVFADPGDRVGVAAFAAAAVDADLVPEDELLDDLADDEVLVGTVTDAGIHIEVVDLRDQQVDDPRSTPSLVRALLSRSHEVYGVSEAGALVVADALARTGASAGALLLPDGDSWRVAAGEGLRRLEHRYVLDADSWLVTTIASRHKGLIIDRTDVARRPLAGAPLAAHKHLVAAPVRAVAGILLIARDDEPPFGERDLLSLARLAEASSGILASALDARQLARLLGDIRDQDDRTAADRIDYGL